MVFISCIQWMDWDLIRDTYVVQKSVHPFSGVHYSDGVVKDVNLWLNRCKRRCPIEKWISWSHDWTYCRFKSLISQKFNKMYYFTGCVDRVCDEDTSCPRNAVNRLLHETWFFLVYRMLQWDILHSFGRLMVLLISLVAGPGGTWKYGSRLTSYITSLEFADPWRPLGAGVGFLGRDSLKYTHNLFWVF